MTTTILYQQQQTTTNKRQPTKQQTNNDDRQQPTTTTSTKNNINNHTINTAITITLNTNLNHNVQPCQYFTYSNCSTFELEINIEIKKKSSKGRCMAATHLNLQIAGGVAYSFHSYGNGITLYWYSGHIICFSHICTVLIPHYLSRNIWDPVC